MALPSIVLPVYKGYTRFAIWPVPHLVSKFCVSLNFFNMCWYIDQQLLWIDVKKWDQGSSTHYRDSVASLLWRAPVCCISGRGQSSGKFCMLSLIYVIKILYQKTIVSEYQYQPDFLDSFIHTYDVPQQKVKKSSWKFGDIFLFQSCPCKDIQFGCVQQVFDTKTLHPCATGICQVLSDVHSMDMFKVIITYIYHFFLWNW